VTGPIGWAVPHPGAIAATGGADVAVRAASVPAAVGARDAARPADER
jgi:hypothetical protein